jgi:O-antigen ligase
MKREGGPITAIGEKRGDSLFAAALVIALLFGTLTLWIPAYWPVAVFEIIILALAVLLLLQGRMPSRKARLPILVLASIVLWGAMQIALGTTTDRFATERAILQWMTWGAVYYAGVTLFAERDLARLVRRVLVWFALLLALEAILQAYLSPGVVYGLFPSGYHDYVMGPIVYHTHYAVFIEALFPLALFQGLRGSRDAYIFLGIAAVLLTSVVVSASRGGIVLVLAELIAVLLLWFRATPEARGRSRSLPVALVAITAVLLTIVGFGTASERFASEAFAAGRLQFARSTLHMIAARPLVGWGLGCWPAVYPAFATFDPGVIVNQAHSDWLQWTAEGGLPVGIAMIALLVWSLRPAVRSIWGIGVVAILVHAAFDYPFSRPVMGAWAFLILAMGACLPGERLPRFEAKAGQGVEQKEASSTGP